jgi:hypothetical protein
MIADVIACRGCHRSEFGATYRVRRSVDRLPGAGSEAASTRRGAKAVRFVEEEISDEKT